MHKLFLTLLTASLLGGSFALCAQTIEWPAYGGSPGGGHYAPVTQINAGNVSRLEQAWVQRELESELLEQE